MDGFWTFLGIESSIDRFSSHGHGHDDTLQGEKIHEVGRQHTGQMCETLRCRHGWEIRMAPWSFQCENHPFLVGGDWNMTFNFPYLGNNHPGDFHIFQVG